MQNHIKIIRVSIRYKGTQKGSISNFQDSRERKTA